ncbi:MAG: YafY family transcriptional regulator [Bacteroidota bacterium]|nr:YafY family transcriptional regulator [Bacteroidota bacterium]
MFAFENLNFSSFHMNRIDRLSAILIQLQSRRRLTAQTLSDKFSISLRTVYRDIHALQEAGVPIIGEAGSGYSLMEGYSVPPVMFDAQETSALLLAGKLMRQKTDETTSRFYDSALDKIRAVLRLREKEKVEEIEGHIFVLNHPTFRYEPPSDLHLQKILGAIGEETMLEMTYSSLGHNQITRRKIEPVGIYYLGNHWHMVAYCHLRQDYRNFRTDQIRKLTSLETPVTRQHPSLMEFVQKSTEEKDLCKVIIEISPEVRGYLGEQKYYAGFVSEETCGDKVILTFLTSSLDGFARWLMTFGDHARILEPENLKEIMSELAKGILKKLNQPSLS